MIELKIIAPLGRVPEGAKVSAPGKDLPIYDVIRGQFFWQPGQGFSLGVPPREPQPNSVISMWNATVLRGQQFYIWPNETLVHWHTDFLNLPAAQAHLDRNRLEIYEGPTEEFWLIAPAHCVRHKATVRFRKEDSPYTLHQTVFTYGGAPGKPLEEPLLHRGSEVVSVPGDTLLQVRFHPRMNRRDILEL